MTDRVLIIASEFPPSPGGIGNHAWNLANSLSDEGLHVVVLTDHKGATPDAIQRFDSSVNYKVVRIPRIFPFFYFLRFFRALALIKKEDIRFVIASGRFSLWIGAFLTFVNKQYLLGILHGSEVNPSNKLFRRLTHYSLNRFDKLVAVSEFTKDLLREIIQTKPIDVISNGININEFEGIHPARKLKGNPTLVTVGNITRRKGQHRVVAALPLLAQRFPEIRYHMIGLPTQKEEVIQLAMSLHVEQHIVIHGRVDQRKEMLQMVADGAIFVMLSENAPDGSVEGFGIAILEANALGIPALGATGCGIEDAIDHAHNGMLVDGNDKQAILSAVNAILNDWNGFSHRSVAWARAHTWSNIIREYIDQLAVK